MKPALTDYKILNMSETYIVLNPYDLRAMPCLIVHGAAYHDYKNALIKRIELYESHLAKYEYLESIGRSFPGND